MAYNEKIVLKLFTYENNAFKAQALIDDYQEISFSDDMFEAGDFTITINYNIPNALKFERGMFIQFGNNNYRFGEILNITDSIGEDGKGSQVRIITGKDARYIFKRRIIKNLNNVENWAMTAKGELCMRNLIQSQCGSGAEEKRRLPIINTIPESEDAVGDTYSVAEAFSNLYDVLVTIATQSKIGWRINFSDSVTPSQYTMTLECFEGVDRSDTIQFSTDFDSLSNGEFIDSSESYANSIYIGGKGQGADRDIYEGEKEISGSSPSGLDRYEAWDNQSSMNTENEYEAEAISMLTQYGQTLELNGQGLAKSPYKYREEYFVGDTITVAFSGKMAKVQILNVTESWSGRGEYAIEFTFGKPQNDLSKQLQLILKQIQKASNKTSTTDSVRWYTIPTDTTMPKGDVVYTTIGFEGACAENGSTFQLYLDDEKTGAKSYHVYFKQLGGGKLTLTTGKTGATDLVMNSGTYVAIIYVDENGNITQAGSTSTNVIEAGNTQSVTSNAVANLNDLNIPVYNTTDPVGSVLDIFDEQPTGTNPNSRVSIIRIFGTFTNTPLGTEALDSDFIYYVNRIYDERYISVMAYNMRSNQVFVNSKRNNIWEGWEKLISNKSKTVPYTMATQSVYSVPDNIFGHRQVGNIVQFAFTVKPNSQGTSTLVTIATGLPKPAVNTRGWTPPTNNVSGTSCGFQITTNGELQVRYGQANISYQFQVVYVTSDF